MKVKTSSTPATSLPQYIISFLLEYVVTGIKRYHIHTLNSNRVTLIHTQIQSVPSLVFHLVRCILLTCKTW